MRRQKSYADVDADVDADANGGKGADAVEPGEEVLVVAS